LLKQRFQFSVHRCKIILTRGTFIIIPLENYDDGHKAYKYGGHKTDKYGGHPAPAGRALPNLLMRSEC
jgi:hypothetical protein